MFRRKRWWRGGGSISGVTVTSAADDAVSVAVVEAGHGASRPPAVLHQRHPRHAARPRTAAVAGGVQQPRAGPDEAGVLAIVEAVLWYCQ